MTTEYATDERFIEASQLGETSSLEEETAVPIEAPIPIEASPIQTEYDKTPVPPRPVPWFRRYSLPVGPDPVSPGAAVEIETEKPFWRLLTVAAPVLPTGVEFSFDRLFRDPDLADLATNLIRIPIGPAQSLFARLKAGVESPLLLSVLVDPRIERR